MRRRYWHRVGRFTVLLEPTAWRRAVAGAILLAVVGSASSPGRAAETPPVRLVDLLAQMTDLDRLAEWPQPAYRTFQVSSHDRRANLPNGRDWFGNADGFGGEPIPGVEAVLEPAQGDKPGRYLLAQVDGPGAIVRTWTAAEDRKYTAINGTIRMYLDGAAKPTFDGSAQDFMLQLYPALARQHGLTPDGLGDGFLQRDAGYFPLPFGRRCRIEWIGRLDEVHFYHIEFRRYAPDTQVETFRPEWLKRDRAAILRTGQRLLAAGSLGPPGGPALAAPAAPATPPALADAAPAAASSTPAGEVISWDTPLEPGKFYELAHLQNRSGKIVELRMKLAAADLNRALRQTVLTVFFDHFARPQIEAPLGDLFAAAPGVNPLRTVPIEVQSDGTMICRFVMPFRERAHLWVISQGSQGSQSSQGAAAPRLTGRMVVAPYAWNADHSMHFHAQWRVSHDMQVPGRRGFDLPFLFAQGQGRLVGCSVHLMNPCAVPTGNWWGEGDEKIFVDDDRLPSFFGTGSEDFFNYSWSVPDLFSHAYFAQPRCDGPFTRGFVTNNRFFVLDDIPFRSRLNFLMEVMHHDVVDGFSYARILYFYGRPGIYSDHTPIMRGDVRPPTAPDNWVPEARSRQQNARFFQFENLDGAAGWIRADRFWALGKCVAWQPPREGEKLSLAFDVPKAGKYRLTLVMGLSPDSGCVGMELNGKPLAAGGRPWTLDLYTPFHTIARHFDAAEPVDLPAGRNTLTLVARGKNAASRGTTILGDFFWILP